MARRRTDPEPIGDLIVRGGQPAARHHHRAATGSPTSSTSCRSSAWPWPRPTARSELRDAAELRVKESDRIALVVASLAAIGARVEERPDGWRVGRGRPRRGGHPHRGRPPHRDGLRDRRAGRRRRHRIHRRSRPAWTSPTPRSGRTWRPSADDPATPPPADRRRVPRPGLTRHPRRPAGRPARLHAGGRPRPGPPPARLRQRPADADRAGRVTWTAGLRFGRTLGSPLAFSVANRDWADWPERMSVEPRPAAAAPKAHHPGPPRPRGPRGRHQVRHATTSATSWSAPRRARPPRVSRPAPSAGSCWRPAA